MLSYEDLAVLLTTSPSTVKRDIHALKQHMNVKKTPVNNAANLSMFRVNVSAKLLEPLRLEHAECSVLDLKASYRGMKYLRETLKILPQKPDPIVIDEIAERLGSIGETIHHTPSQLNTS